MFHFQSSLTALSFQPPLGGGGYLGRSPRDILGCAAPPCFQVSHLGRDKGVGKGRVPCATEGGCEGPALLCGTEGHCCPQTSQHIHPQPLPSCLPKRGTCWKSRKCQQATSSSVLSLLDQWSSVTSPGLPPQPLLGVCVPARASTAEMAAGRSCRMLPDTHTASKHTPQAPEVKSCPQCCHSCILYLRFSRCAVLCLGFLTGGKCHLVMRDWM